MARKSREPAKLELNLTSMMDVVFQLIIFFLLINNMSSAELPKLKPPEPVESKAIEPDPNERRVIINVIPEGTTGRVERLRIGIRDIAAGDYGVLTDLLKIEKETNEKVQIDLRADASVYYEHVQPVMNAITAAGISRINLVALKHANK
jgi:biopolymer transport protein ExbD